MEYFLGIDQGGSKTAAVVGDGEGHILGTGISHGSVYSDPGMLEDAMSACAEAAQKAVREAGISFRQVGYLCGGITGIDWQGDDRFIEAQFGKRFGIPHVHAVNDCIIAMRAGTSSPDRVVICAGSGVNCAVHSKDGEIIFGFYIPDAFQGGSSIGKAALQKVFDAEAGIGKETTLKEKLLEYYQVPDVSTLLKNYVEGRISSSSILSVPLIVEEQALKGDEAANDILRTFAHGIVPYLTSGARKLHIEDKKVTGEIPHRKTSFCATHPHIFSAL